jgi:hypothetical protein
MFITHKINLLKVKSKASAFKPMIFPELADCFFFDTPKLHRFTITYYPLIFKVCSFSCPCNPFLIKVTSDHHYRQKCYVYGHCIYIG